MARHISTVETAKMVRKLLKANYPGTKFSVISKSGVRIVWADGPSKAQVKKLLAPFEGKHYDGQYERTEYAHSWILADGSVVFAQKEIPVPEGAEEVCFGSRPSLIRKHSKALIEAAAIAGKKKYGWDAPAIQGYDGDYSFVLDLSSREPLHRWFTEVLEAMTEYPEKQEAAEAAPVDPEPKELDLGPCPSDNIQAVHWTGQHIAHLMGSDWSYEGNPKWRSCDIMHTDGYGIHLWINNNDPKAKVSGNWPHLIDEFHRGGYSFTPNDRDIPTMGFTLGRPPAKVLKDIKRRFLPQYLEQYPKCVIVYETTKRRGIKRLALLKKLEADFDGYRDGSFRSDRVHLKTRGHDWASVTVDCYVRAEATSIDLPVGREVITMHVVDHLRRSTNKCPALAQLEDDQGAIKAALAALECIPEKHRSQALTNAMEELENAWDLLQDGIGHLSSEEEPNMVWHGQVLLTAD